MTDSPGRREREETRTGYGEAEEEARAPEPGEPGAGADGGGADRTAEAPPAGDPPGPPGDADGALRCDLCGGPVQERHCKIVCLNCGYQRDCSDP